jgi:hypothetical protein
VSKYRVGSHWGVTIVREGSDWVPGNPHPADDQLVAVVVNGDRELAERICALLNADEKAPGGCDCDHEGLDAMFHLAPCPVAELSRTARRLGYELTLSRWEVP